MANTVRLDQLEGRIAALTLDAPDMPFVFGEAQMSQLRDAVATLAARTDVDGLIIRSTHPETFCAGADVDAMAALAAPSEAERLVTMGQEVYVALARLPMPRVALIHGTCVGGGLELALSCSARVATESAKLGLPETKLGILPAWGGSTRLPRLIGLVPAIEMITAGRIVNAFRARKAGLVDSICPRESMEREGRRLIAILREKGSLPRPKPPLAPRLLAAIPGGPGFVAKQARKKILAETHGHYPAPLRALDVIIEQHGQDPSVGMAAERKAVVELLATPVARELLRLFLLTRDSARPAIYSEAKDAPALREVAVIGAGVMGAGIAQVCATKGLAVRIIDAFPESLAKARKSIVDELRRLSDRRDITTYEAANRLSRVTFSTAIDGLRGVDLVIEAVPERRDVKDKVLRAVCAQVRDDAIVATNTSSFPLDDLAASVTIPERFMGLHFFNPAPKMPLLEVVCGSSTTEENLRRGVRFAKEIGKTAVVVADAPGFLVNRLLAPYFREACNLAAEGVPITVVDDALVAFGMPMGPFTLMDTVGIDVLRDASVHMAERTQRELLHPVVRDLAEKKDFGRKTGRGFYGWTKTGRGDPNPAAIRADRPAGSWMPLRDDITRRLIHVMVLEAKSALDEGLVPTPEEIDIATIFGIGFPPFRGGLMHYANVATAEVTV